MLKIFAHKHLRYSSCLYPHMVSRVLVASVLIGLIGLLGVFELAVILPVIPVIVRDNEFDLNVTGHMRSVTDFIATMGRKLDIKIVMLFFFTLKSIVRFADLYYMVGLQNFLIKKLSVYSVEMFRRSSFRNMVELQKI